MGEIVKRELTSLPIRGMQDMATLGQAVAEAGMLGVASPAAGLMVVATCHQEGMSLLEFGRRYHVDNRGKVTMRSDRMLAEFMAMGGTCKWVTAADDRTKQTAEFSYGVNQNYPVTFSYSEAEQAGYVKPGTNWEKDPAAQMRARVITRGIRMVCPAAVAGIYTPDEMQDVYSSDPEQQAAPHAAPVEDMQAAQSVVTPHVTIEAEPTPFDAPDYSICPVNGCEFTGKKWADLPADALEQAKGLGNMGVTAGHVLEIEKEQARRQRNGQ